MFSITTSSSVFLSTYPNHLSLPCSPLLHLLQSFSPHVLTISVFHVLHYYIFFSLSLYMSNHLSLPCSPLLHLLQSFSPHGLTISVFHVLITTSSSVFLSTCLTISVFLVLHYYIFFSLSLYMSNHLSLPCSPLLHLLQSFSPHVLTISVFHVLHYYIFFSLSLDMS